MDKEECRYVLRTSYQLVEVHQVENGSLMNECWMHDSGVGLSRLGDFPGRVKNDDEKSQHKQVISHKFHR